MRALHRVHGPLAVVHFDAHTDTWPRSAKRLAQGRSSFVDLDFFDPAFAPGVATPAPGGATPEEGLRLMRGMTGLNVVGIDINTTAPLHDAADATAILGASLLAEALGVLGSNHAAKQAGRKRQSGAATNDQGRHFVDDRG